MNKIKQILKSQTGQGVWEYMVILVGVGILAFAVTTAFHGNLTTKETGTVDQVTGKLDDIVKGTTELEGGPTGQ